MDIKQWITWLTVFSLFAFGVAQLFHGTSNLALLIEFAEQVEDLEGRDQTVFYISMLRAVILMVLGVTLMVAMNKARAGDTLSGLRPVLDIGSFVVLLFGVEIIVIATDPTFGNVMTEGILLVLAGISGAIAALLMRSSDTSSRTAAAVTAGIGAILFLIATTQRNFSMYYAFSGFIGPILLASIPVVVAALVAAAGAVLVLHTKTSPVESLGRMVVAAAAVVFGIGVLTGAIGLLTDRFWEFMARSDGVQTAVNVLMVVAVVAGLITGILVLLGSILAIVQQGGGLLRGISPAPSQPMGHGNPPPARAPPQQVKDPSASKQEHHTPGITCSSCGTRLPGNARFCASCGSEVPWKGYCSSCGTETRPEHRFCLACGSQVGVSRS